MASLKTSSLSNTPRFSWISNHPATFPGTKGAHGPIFLASEVYFSGSANFGADPEKLRACNLFF